MAEITGCPRERIDIEWSRNLWVHNLFRAWELLFWRRAGIRLEIVVSADRNEYGETVAEYKFYTLESIVAHIEGMIRMRFRSWKPSFRLVAIAVPQFAGVGDYRKPIYVLAIAFDGVNSANNASTTSLSYSVTTSGSNRYMVTGGSQDGTTDRLTGITYNLVAETVVGTTETETTDGSNAQLYNLIAPTVGANNVVLSYSGTSGARSATASYTGARQASQPDSNSQNHTTTLGTTASQSTTTVADNSWAVCYVQDTRDVVSAGSNTTLRSAAGSAKGIFDGNAAVTPAGSTTLNFVQSSSGYFVMKMLSVAPATGGVIARPKLNLLRMGVG